MYACMCIEVRANANCKRSVINSLQNSKNNYQIYQDKLILRYYKCDTNFCFFVYIRNSLITQGKDFDNGFSISHCFFQVSAAPLSTTASCAGPPLRPTPLSAFLALWHSTRFGKQTLTSAPQRQTILQTTLLFYSFEKWSCFLVHDHNIC